MLHDGHAGCCCMQYQVMLYVQSLDTNACTDTQHVLSFADVLLWLCAAQILACMHATVSHIDSLRTKYANVPCASEISTHSAYTNNSMYSCLPYRPDGNQEASSFYAASPVVDIGSARLLSSFPQAYATSPLETASSLSSSTTSFV